MIGEQVVPSLWQKSSDATARMSRPLVVTRPKGRQGLHPILYPLIKRFVDMLASAVLLLILAPLLLIIAIAVKLDSPGPAIYTQRRVGKGGRIFSFYKFRSMRPDAGNDRAHRRFAEAYISGESLDDLAGDEAEPIYKPKNGNNVTRVGRFLRATSLDELPQLINVLKGDMSLVGPRPSIYYEVDLYRGWHRQRLAVTPGLTGYAQINGRSSLRFDEIVRLDIEYIHRCCTWLDLKILLLTLPVVLSTRSAR